MCALIEQKRVEYTQCYAAVINIFITIKQLVGLALQLAGGSRAKWVEGLLLTLTDDFLPLNII